MPGVVIKVKNVAGMVLVWTIYVLLMLLLLFFIYFF